MFGQGLGSGPEDTSIVQAVISLAHALGLGDDAEAVECEAQMRQLRRLGCELAQGYCFSRPLSPQDADGLLIGSPTEAAPVPISALLVQSVPALAGHSADFDD